MTDETQETAAPEVSKVEAEARLLGWRPLEEFDGPEERFKPAEEFLEEGKRINGFLRKDLDKLRNEVTRRDQDIAELRQTITEFADFHRQTEEKAYKRARADLLAEKKVALSEGDGDKVVEIEERLELLNEAAPNGKPVPSAPPPGPDPIFMGWVTENTWFRDDPKLRAITNGYGELLRQENGSLTGRPFLDEVKRRVQADFPDLFEPVQRRRAGAVGSSGESRGHTNGKRGYADLPAEVKAQCDKFVKQGLVKSREQYVQDYFGE